MLLTLLLTQGGGAPTPTNYALTCAAGNYTLTGNAATLKQAHSLTCSAGSYALTGNAATLKQAHSLVCAAGAYSLTGNAATLQQVHSLTCSAGTYSLTGNDATLTHVAGVGAVAYTLACNAGGYTLTGGNSALNVAHGLQAEAGAYSLSGAATSLSIGRSLNCATGSYSLTGNAATLAYVAGVGSISYTLACDAGAYGLSADYFDAGYIDDGYIGNITFLKGEVEQPQTGGGYFAYHQKKLRKKLEYDEQKAKEAYEEILESAPIEVKKQAIAIVKPFSETNKKTPAPASIDWVALEREAYRVNALLALWQEQIDIEREDEEILLLM